MRRLKIFSAVIVTIALTACKSAEPLPVVDYVDLEKFMGDWFVIANIPTFIEKNVFNPVESYRLNQDGTVATTFAFNKGSFGGERKDYYPKGYVVEGTGNAIWGLQFIWPFKADYRVVYLDADYETTIIGRNKRDYVWIMARTPAISDSEYAELIEIVEAMGYSPDQLRRLPHRVKE